MKVLELFSGRGIVAQTFKDRGHEVYRVEKNTRFDAEHRDVFTYEPPAGYFDFAWASPVCTGFTVARIGVNWTHAHEPKTESARLSLSMAQRTRYILKAGRIPSFVIENPRAKLRKLPVVGDLRRTTVTYCQYGERVMKPTDLWYEGLTLDLKAPCANGAPCHVRAPRGSTTGTQGMDPAEAGKIPRALALAVCLAAERAYMMAKEL